MKKLLFILFTVLSTTGIAQKNEWAPVGAVWHYTYACNGPCTGYITVESVGDSIIDGKVCMVLEKRKYIYNYLNSKIDSSILGLEFTYSENNIVYYYRHNKFYVLYNFNAQPGDWWEVTGTPYGFCDSTGIIKVDSIGKMVINQDTLKYLYVTPDDTSNWYFFTNKIVEKIGCLGGYMFPELFLCILDVNEGGPLRCYEDTVFGYYQTEEAPYCDYLPTAIKKIENANDKFLIIPNPVNDKINIVSSKTNVPFFVTVYNVNGSVIFDKYCYQNEITINLQPNSNGIFLLKILYKNQMYIKKIISY